MNQANREHLQMLLQTSAVHFGIRIQLAKTLEELGECSAAVARMLLDDSSRTNRNNLVSEMADVHNMLEQIEMLMGVQNEVEVERYGKMRRTLARVWAKEQS